MLQHHHGLMVCWNIKKGLEKNVDVARIQSYANWFYQNQLKEHFEMEEKLLFPLLDAHHKWIIQAISDHERISSLFENVHTNRSSLELLVLELDKHIRMEEGYLFPEMQLVATSEQLKLLTDIHEVWTDADQWEDDFWND